VPVNTSKLADAQKSKGTEEHRGHDKWIDHGNAKSFHEAANEDHSERWPTGKQGHLCSKHSALNRGSTARLDEGIQ
jgi:hypothetical protein